MQVQGQDAAPSHIVSKSGSHERMDLTLRDFLMDSRGYHLAMAPSFFGYYGYFGALAAWEDEMSNSTFNVLRDPILGVAGASSGAMAAILLGAGVPPTEAAEFCTTISLNDFNDFPGLLTVFRGDKFQEIMFNYLESHLPDTALDLQDAVVPVAVTGFDIQTMEGKVLKRGNMARAARASACFPLLFQPVGWVEGEENYLFVDGGLADTSGVQGLAAIDTQDMEGPRRIVNMVVGDFHLGRPLGPSDLPAGMNATEVLSISIQSLPQCGPWAMENGPLAVEGSRMAMRASVDQPLIRGKEDGHYELHIDASSFVPIAS